MKAYKHLMVIFLFVPFLIFLSVHQADAVRGVTEDTIKMGLILVKTGPVATLGLPHAQGTIDYFNYINEKGGVHGRKIVVIHEDDEFKTPKAIAAFKKLLYRDEVFTIITMGGTPQTIALLEDIQKEKVVNIPNGLADEMYTPHKPYIFTLGATYETQIKVMFDYIMKDLKAKDPKVSVVFAETEFGKKGQAAAKARAEEYGIKLVSEIVLPIGAVDASSQVLSLMNDKVEYVITCNLVPPTITFLKTAEKYNYWPITFGINWATDDMVVKSVGPAGKTYIGANFVGGWFDDTPGMKLVREIVAKYGSKPGLTSLYLNGIATGMIYEEGFKRAGKNLTPDTLKDALETFRDFDTRGIVPPITYKPGDHSPSPFVKLFKTDVSVGKLVPVTDWRIPAKVR